MVLVYEASSYLRYNGRAASLFGSAPTVLTPYSEFAQRLSEFVPSDISAACAV